MFTELAQAEIVNGAVLVATLHSDLGGHRKIGPMRLLRPLSIAAGIVPLFIDPVVTHGNGLALELAGTAAGLLGGLIAVSLMKVYRSPKTGKPVSSAKWGYAALWSLIIGARAAFSYGASHWFPQQLAHWCMAHQVTGDAITDGLIFMAVAMMLARTLGLAARAATLPADTEIRPAAGRPTAGSHPTCGSPFRRSRPTGSRSTDRYCARSTSATPTPTTPRSCTCPRSA